VNRRKLEIWIIVSAMVLDVVLGVLYSFAEHLPVWHGIFCAVANAVTDGGDVAPSNPWGYAITSLEYVIVVPLFAATFSLFTTIVTTRDVKKHIDKRHQEMKTHVSEATK
jgi:hypothetical protein